MVIGLDGMPYTLIRSFSEDGTMPHLKNLITEGVFRQMASSIPEISSVAWSSIITGKNPGEHGIFGFSDLMPDSYSVCFPNFNNLKAPSFWEEADVGRSVIINVPATYPARAFSGVLISGFVALDLNKAVYPSSLVPELERMAYRLDVDSEKAHKSMALFLEDLEKTLRGRIAAYRYLWEHEDWQTFMLVFTGTDRLAHFLWEAFEDDGHVYHGAVLEHFRQIDEAIGEITTRLGDNGSVILLSDHGFERLERDVNVNAVLAEHGFLRLRQGRKNLRDIDPKTTAFALDPGRIYLNTITRFPRGSVREKQRNALLDELTALFENLEFEGRKVVRGVYRKEELFHGPHVDHAPALVLVGDKGFNLKGNIKAEEVYTKGPFTGKHSQPDAFLLVRGKEKIELPERPSVTDVVSIIEQCSKGG